MGIYTRPLDLYNAQLARFKKVGASARKGHELMCRSLHEDARLLSTGPLNEKMLRALGHPYGRKLGVPSGAPRGIATGRVKGALAVGAVRRARLRGQVFGKTRHILRPLPINRNTGRLHAGWRLQKRFSVRGQTFDLGSHVPHAKHVLLPTGTRRMIARGLWEPGKGNRAGGELGKRWMARNRALLDHLRGLQRT